MNPSDLKFEIGHVLFIDIVGYSKLLINEQSEQIQTLKEIVRGTEQVRIAEGEGKLLRLPTGDGGALVFRNSPEAPVRCALEIASELQNHPGSKEKPQLRLRMGIHSGPVNEVVDLNEQANIAGAGINIAQRVMDCGDAGHILLSKRVAEDLAQYRQWQALLHDLGEVGVKHGVRVHVFNLYNEEIGNPELPEKLRLAKAATATASAASPEEGFWVAVLPFKCAGANADLSALAEGLSEDIVTGLSRFSYLRVIARSSTARFAQDSGDVRAIGKELGARYVMEGSLRQVGAKLRLAVQVVDTTSGAHLWAENYERAFGPEAVFEIQDDLVPRIVSTVADVYGVLPYSMSDVVRSKPADQLTPYEALIRAFGYGFRINPEEQAAARASLERAVEQSPAYADAWAMLSLLYANDYGFEFGGQRDPLGRALEAARRATDAAPSNAFAQSALAKTLFFRKEFPAFRSAAEKAISLNPMDGAMLADLGAVLAYSGDWERGCVLVERAMQLNPRHPPWFWLPLSYNAYRKGDYHGSVNAALRVNLPGFFVTHEVLAAAYGQLGERDAARQSLGEMLKLVPDFGKIARGLKSKWFVPEMVEHVLDGLRKAGLEIAGDDGTPSLPTTVGKSSSTKREDEGFWVAVLPFKYAGANADPSALADGLTDEIVTGLSRFSYLNVISRSSTSRYANELFDIRSAGKQLGARYVMEGSLRQAGTKLRLAVQLVDTISGAHLWAENYERTFSPEAVFELQDELVPRIVSTVADQYGALVHSMSESLRGRSAGEYSAHEAVLRAFGYQERFTREEHEEVREILEAAIARAPSHSDCLAELSCVYWHEYVFGYNPRPDSLGRALATAQRAVASAPTNHFAHAASAYVLFFQKNFPAFRSAAERALALNRMDSSTMAMLGLMFAYS
ncbi:MAG: adenylate/guanylate cyclase domain-containing protein, partial [Candidatus Udaeobacter sp.]